MEQVPLRGQEWIAAGEVITENVSMCAAEENGSVLCWQSYCHKGEYQGSHLVVDENSELIVTAVSLFRQYSKQAECVTVNVSLSFK